MKTDPKRGPDPVDLNVGRLIRLARIEAGLSQTAIADRLGVTFQQVQKYEKGANRVAPSRLVKIAELVKKPVEWFYDRDAAASLPANLSAMDVEIVRLLERVPPNIKADVRSLLRTLADNGE